MNISKLQQSFDDIIFHKNKKFYCNDKEISINNNSGLEKYYVYFLVDPRTNLPFYCGKGCGNRALVHLKNKDYNKNKLKFAIVDSIHSDNLEVVVEIMAFHLNEDTAHNIEKQLIKILGRIKIDNDGILTNRMLDNRQPQNQKGKIISQKTIEAIRKANLGSKRTKEQKLNMRNSRLKYIILKYNYEIHNRDRVDGKIEYTNNLSEYAKINGYSLKTLWHSVKTGKPSKKGILVIVLGKLDRDKKIKNIEIINID